MDKITMYELDNEQPDGVDLPEGSHNAYKNQFILESFLHKMYPVQLDWGNQDMKFIVLIESDSDIVGMSALIPYRRKAKVHLCVMAITNKWHRKGLGTEMLKHIAVMYPHKEVTLSVPFEQPDVLSFYMSRGYAKMRSVDTEKKCFVLSLVNLKLLSDVSLPS